jgi:hypothetical protein
LFLIIDLIPLLATVRDEAEFVFLPFLCHKSLMLRAPECYMHLKLRCVVLFANEAYSKFELLVLCGLTKDIARGKLVRTFLEA